MTKYTEGEPIVQARIEATFKGIKDFEKAFASFTDMNIRKEWETNMSDLKIVEENKETNEQVYYAVVKAPVPLMSDRDNIMRKVIK